MMIFFLYLIISLLFTFPLIIDLGSILPGTPNDAYVYLWNIGNFWNQISNNQNIFYTQNVMYPIGANLFFHTYAPFISVLSLPFLNNIPQGMGIFIILSIPLSAFFSYLLIYKLTSNKVTSFIAGVAYAFSPIMHSFLESQHYYFLFSANAYPLGLLFSIDYFEKSKTKYLIYILLLFWIVLAIDYYSAVLYVLLIGLFFLLNSRLNFKKISLYFGHIVLFLIMPFMYLFLTQSTFREFLSFKPTLNTASSCNTNVAGFVLPNSQNPLLRPLSEKMRTALNLEINLDTPSYFLGWGLVIIFILSLKKNYKDKYIKSIFMLFLIFFILSLGTNIKIGEQVMLKDELTPFYYLLKLPVFSSIDCTIRFPILIQLCFAIILGKFIVSKKNAVFVAIAVGLILLIEYFVINKNFSEINVPSVYKLLAQEGDDKTLLEIPSGITESKSAFGYDWSIQALHSQQMYWQTVHKKPKIGVYISRLTSDKYSFFKSEPVISEIFTFSSLGGTKPTYDIKDEHILSFIKKFNLGYIILSPNSRQTEFSDFIENEFFRYIVSKQNIDGFIYYKLSLSQS